MWKCAPFPIPTPLEDRDGLFGRLATQMADVGVDGANENEGNEREQQPVIDEFVVVGLR